MGEGLRKERSLPGRKRRGRSKPGKRPYRETERQKGGDKKSGKEPGIWNMAF